MCNSSLSLLNTHAFSRDPAIEIVMGSIRVARNAYSANRPFRFRTSVPANVEAAPMKCLWVLLTLSLIAMPERTNASTAESSLASVSSAPCPAVAGVEALTQDTRKFVIVGEMHGTAEVPRLFGDLVCTFAKTQPVAIALEFSKTSTPALQKYLASTGSDQDRRELLKAPMWDKSLADGRSSTAMLVLLDRLRQLRAAGMQIRIYATQPDAGLTMDQHYYELMMASEWVRIASANANARVLVLVGNIHAKLRRPANLAFAPAATFLIETDTLSLDAESSGGSAWNCQKDGCGAHKLSGVVRKPAFVGLLLSSTEGHNGTYSVGSPFTASPPAKSGIPY